MAARRAPRAPTNRRGVARSADTGLPARRGRSGHAEPATADTVSSDSEPAADPTERAAVLAALEAAGLLLPPPEFDDLPTDPAELDALIRKDEAWLLATFKEPLGLSEAVIEDRR